jgi:23S rRNA (pseudouridine1915-N3)-methyltransferase
MIYCLYVGSIREKRLKAWAEEYRKRLERLWPVSVVEVPEKDKEILKWIEGKKGRGTLVSLDAAGESMTSEAFAQWVTRSPRDIFFIAWGADGPSPAFLGRFDRKISLSPMTYPHEWARVLLMEQLYRAGASLRGHPYPK